MLMPKPDLTALTGGYRRIPVLQIGADVYCDTASIARRLEAISPEPACISPASAGLAGMIEDWADHRLAFQVVPPVLVEMLPELPPAVLADRAAMSPTFTPGTWAAAAPRAWRQALSSLDHLERQLAERPFLLGDGFSIADAACFHPVWFSKRSAKLFRAVGARSALEAWFARIEGFGTGDVRPLSNADAVSVARRSDPTDVEGGVPTMNGFALGDSVAVTADDYGSESSRGTIVRLTADEITILRRDAASGDIAVHFPWSGYRIDKDAGR